LGRSKRKGSSWKMLGKSSHWGGKRGKAVLGTVSSPGGYINFKKKKYESKVVRTGLNKSGLAGRTKTDSSNVRGEYNVPHPNTGGRMVGRNKKNKNTDRSTYKQRTPAHRRRGRKRYEGSDVGVQGATVFPKEKTKRRKLHGHCGEKDI